MIELIARDMPSAIVMPQEIDRRKRRSSGTRAAIGALIILDDGSQCMVAGYDQRGRPICYPVQE